MEPVKVCIPSNSRIAELAKTATFCDAWQIQIGPDEATSALDYFLQAVKQTPKWVEICMMLRNQTVQRLGLKNLGGLADIPVDASWLDFKVGDQVGIFELYENHFDEALLGDKDKHLNVVLSIHREQTLSGVCVTLSTVVHVKNWLGHLYMLPVKPMHGLIAPSVLRTIRE